MNVFPLMHKASKQMGQVFFLINFNLAYYLISGICAVLWKLHIRYCTTFTDFTDWHNRKRNIYSKLFHSERINRKGTLIVIRANVVSLALATEETFQSYYLTDNFPISKPQIPFKDIYEPHKTGRAADFRWKVQSGSPPSLLSSQLQREESTTLLFTHIYFFEYVCRACLCFQSCH